MDRVMNRMRIGMGRIGIMVDWDGLGLEWGLF